MIAHRNSEKKYLLFFKFIDEGYRELYITVDASNLFIDCSPRYDSHCYSHLNYNLPKTSN